MKGKESLNDEIEDIIQSQIKLSSVPLKFQMDSLKEKRVTLAITCLANENRDNLLKTLLGLKKKKINQKFQGIENQKKITINEKKKLKKSLSSQEFKDSNLSKINDISGSEISLILNDLN